MKCRYFTIIELLVAIAVMMVVSNVLAQVYIKTTQVAMSQAGSHEMYTQAMNALDVIAEDFKKIRVNDLGTGERVVFMLGSYYNHDTTNYAASTAGLPRLAFVTSNPEFSIYEDSNYDGLKEVCYALKSESSATGANDGDFVGQYFTLYRAENESKLVSNTFESNDIPKPAENILLENVVYFGFKFIRASGNSYYINTTTDFPDAVEISISLAANNGAAQRELIFNQNGSAGPLEYQANNCTKINNFSFDSIGYLINTSNSKISRYTFNGNLTISDPYGNGATQNVSSGHRAIVGHTFTRVYSIR